MSIIEIKIEIESLRHSERYERKIDYHLMTEEIKRKSLNEGRERKKKHKNY
jgi:hypothetical protein